MGFGPRSLPGGPVSRAFPITPNDDEDLVVICQKLYVGGGGDVTVSLFGAQNRPVTFKNVSAGSTIDALVTRVHAAGTTATDLLGMH